MNNLIGFTAEGFVVFVAKASPLTLTYNKFEESVLHQALQNFVDMAKLNNIIASNEEIQTAQQLLDSTAGNKTCNEINQDLRSKVLANIKTNKDEAIADLTECDVNGYTNTTGGNDNENI